MNSKNIIRYGAYTAIVLLILMLGMKSCNIYDSYSVLKGQYELLQVENKELIKVNEQEIAEYQAKIADRNKKIEEIIATVALKNDKIQGLHQITTNLEQELSNLVSNEDKIINLQKQVTSWKDKFTLIESIVKDKDEIIFNLQEKYNAQLKISLNYKEMYEQSQQLVLLADKRLKLADRKIRSVRLGSTVKTIVIGTVVGFVIYDKVVK